jgi:arylsulfatase
MILEKQKKLGVVPADAKLTERIEAIPAWDSLNAEERKLYARQMEVFAAMLEHVDHEIGRIVATLERVGVLDDTLIYVINAVQTPFETNMRYFDAWGGPSTYPHYHAGWAMAGNTPFRYFKQAVHRGGIQDPLIAHWPKGIQGRGEVRSQYHHIADVAPTLLDILGLEVPEEIDGVTQQPMDGTSMFYAFNDAKAPDAKKVQYYEMFGNRAIWADGWKAVTLHGNRMPWDVNVVLPFDQDRWQLYHVAEDFSEADDVASEHPEKLEELKQLFDEQARKYHVYPLYDDMMRRIAKQHERMFGDRRCRTSTRASSRTREPWTRSCSSSERFRRPSRRSARGRRRRRSRGTEVRVPTAPRSRTAAEAQRQVVQAADDEGRRVGERARVHQLQVVEAREQPLEADARLGAREAGAGTEVLAVAEGDVAP